MADNGAMVVSPQDRDLMIRTVIGETGATDPSSVGVASVIANRMRKTGQSATQVVLAPNQFEPWASRSKELLSYAPSSAPYQSAAKVVDGVLSGNTPDPTNGATQFYAPAAQKALGRSPPDFENGTGVQIGAHRFFGGQPVAQNDWLSQSVGGNSSPPASSATAKTSPPPVVATAATPPPSADWLAHSAGTDATPTSSGVPPQASPPGSYPLGDPRNQGLLPFSYRTSIPSASNPAPTTVDPSDPITTQLATAAKLAGGYALGQVKGIPSAIASDFNNSDALVGQGLSQMAKGDVLPSFPSSNPASWGAGGALKSALGAAGMVSSPLTGVIHQTVQDPVTDLTGSPQAGEVAGMAAGALAGPQVGRVVSALRSGIGDATIGTLDPETARLAQVARDQFNIPVNAGQMSPSPGIRVASSALNRLPMSGAENDAAVQQGAFNRAVANTVGENADKLSPAVMNSARKRIGSYYDQVASSTNLNVDPQFIQDIHTTLNDAAQVLPADQVTPLVRQAQAIVSKIDSNTKTISGDTYQALTNQGAPLDRLIDASDPTVGYYANNLKKALDGALQRSATPENQALLKTADRQWWALKTIQPLAAKAPTGDISPALLAGRVNANTGNAMAFGGGGDLGTLARIGQRFLKEPGSSNTAERASTIGTMYRAGQLGVSALGAGALGVNAGMTPAELGLSAASIPASLLAGRAIGSGLRSDWLANSLIKRTLAPNVARPVPALSAITGPAAAASALNNSPSQQNFLGP